MEPLIATAPFESFRMAGLAASFDKTESNNESLMNGWQDRDWDSQEYYDAADEGEMGEESINVIHEERERKNPNNDPPALYLHNYSMRALELPPHFVTTVGDTTFPFDEPIDPPALHGSSSAIQFID